MALKKYLTEILDEINKSPKKLEEYKTDPDVDLLFKYAFHPNGKMLLPEGDPPFKPDAAPMGMSPAVFRQELQRFYIFCRKDLTSVKREQLFISMLESIHPEEAKVLIAVKDQNLTKLYKKITRKIIEEAGIVPPLTPNS